VRVNDACGKSRSLVYAIWSLQLTFFLRGMW